MRTKDAAVVAGTALATAIVARALLGIVPAVEAEQGNIPGEAKPALIADGVTVTIDNGGNAMKPGGKAEVTVVAKNDSDKPASLPVAVDMICTPIASEMSRMMPVSSRSMLDERELNLKPGETVRYGIASSTPLKENVTVSFLVRSGRLSASTPTVAVKSAVVAKGEEPILARNNSRETTGNGS